MRARLNQGLSMAGSESDPFKHEDEDPAQELVWGQGLFEEGFGNALTLE